MTCYRWGIGVLGVCHGEGSVNGLIIRSDFSSEGYWCFRFVFGGEGVGVGIAVSLSFLVEETKSSAGAKADGVNGFRLANCKSDQNCF